MDSEGSRTHEWVSRTCHQNWGRELKREDFNRRKARRKPATEAEKAKGSPMPLCRNSVLLVSFEPTLLPQLATPSAARINTCSV